MNKIKLPKKFEFECSGDYYGMVLKYEFDEVYTCTSFKSGNTFDLFPHSYKQYFEDGTYKITKNLDEPELVFPFEILEGGVAPFRLNKTEDIITMFSIRDGYYLIDGLFTENQIKEKIKCGYWIITSVGEQAPTSVVSTLKVEVCQTDITKALEGCKELTEAYEELAVAIERVNKLMKGVYV